MLTRRNILYNLVIFIIVLQKIFMHVCVGGEQKNSRGNMSWKNVSKSYKKEDIKLSNVYLVIELILKQSENVFEIVAKGHT